MKFIDWSVARNMCVCLCMPKVMILFFFVVKEVKYTYAWYTYMSTVYPDDITLEEPLAIHSFPFFQAWWRPLVWSSQTSLDVSVVTCHLPWICIMALQGGGMMGYFFLIHMGRLEALKDGFRNSMLCFFGEQGWVFWASRTCCVCVCVFCRCVVRIYYILSLT